MKSLQKTGCFRLQSLLRMSAAWALFLKVIKQLG